MGEYTEWLRLRVRPDQLERFQRTAELERSSLSEWVRRACLIRVAEMAELAPRTSRDTEDR